MTDTLYPYTECGLDNVYLANGYTLRETPYGETLAIHDIDRLHRAIGLALVRRPGGLSGAELRFLRVELGWSQEELARLLGRDKQTVGRWERGESNIDPLAERVLKLIFTEHAGAENTPRLTERLSAFAAETAGGGRMDVVMEERGGWQSRAA
ncbi:helix-turn-helix domain-containing protein [Tistrella mobilis]|uniref:helix-turn-helix domain-containing protein n=1 Tax=Tistrella mobilis TaxID=171437 RepID=UPI0005A2E17F|nr:helix-turn-helix domain-containing protein [Tistrella mobilis]